MQIVERGNTAEVKRVKDGIAVLEVKRKIILREENRDVPGNGRA